MSSFSTPVTRNGERSLRRRPREVSSPKSSPVVLATSTPRVEGKRTMSFSEEEEDEEEFELPCTQFQPGRDGEIFYNLEASPRVKEELRRRLEEADAKSPTGKCAPAPLLRISNRIKFRQRRGSPGQRTIDHVLDDVRQSCKEFDEATRKEEEEGIRKQKEQEEERKKKKMAKAKEEEVMRRKLRKQEKRTFSTSPPVPSATLTRSRTGATTLPAERNSSTIKLESDPLSNSDDDSFLVRCSQVVDRCGARRTGLAAPPRRGEVAAAKESDDPFDSADDSFDVILSQLDTKSPHAPSPSMKKAVRGSDPKFKATLLLPHGDAGQAGAEERHQSVAADNLDSSFKRFHSTGCYSSSQHGNQQQQVDLGTSLSSPSSAPALGNFSRIHSTPDLPASKVGKPLLPGGRILRSKTSGNVRCSQEEIERKRQEALKKRQRKNVIAQQKLKFSHSKRS